MNSNEVIKDINSEFDFLREYNFKHSGSTIHPHRVSSGFKGDRYDILLIYEYSEENFDFSMIDNEASDKHKQLWILIEKYAEAKVPYFEIKPTMKEYKLQLKRIASEFKKVLPVILSLEKKDILI